MESTRGSLKVNLIVAVVVGVATFGIIALLVNIFERKQEATRPFVKVVELTEISTDPQPWGLNFPLQYESYKRTVDSSRTEYGGNHALAPSKLKESPWLKRLFSGYAFCIDYREARGHAFMLSDQEVTKRVTEVQQAGACLHCHASVIPTYRRLGLEQQGKEATAEALSAAFNQEAVVAGFKFASQKKYEEIHAELSKTPHDHGTGDAHPVSCLDCHDPKTMESVV